MVGEIEEGIPWPRDEENRRRRKNKRKAILRPQ
jgi:hypothetical protein